MKNKVLLLLASSLLLVGSVEISIANKKEKLVDDITYSDPSIKELSKPDFTRGMKRNAGGDDDDEEEEVGPVNRIILTYVNDDKDCKNRAFYVWRSDVDGYEFSDVTAPEGTVTYSSEGDSMTLTLDLEHGADPAVKGESNLDELAASADKTSIMYIIKYKKKSASDLNWGGQSEDVQLSFVEFPPVDGVVKCWCTPAAGGGIGQFHTEAETKVEGVKLAKFSDWKTIDCSLSQLAYDVKWDLYAFDETYYKIKPKKRAAVKRNYLVASGSTKKSSFKISLKYNAHINVVYSLVSKNTDKQGNEAPLEKTIFVSFENLYGTKRFEQFYNYKGNDLGVTYSKGETTFKVWSPVAANVSLNVYDSDTSESFGGSDALQGWHMCYQPGGIWQITLKGNLDGKYYNYTVDTWNGSSTTMDPYATSSGRNGIRGFIYDKSKANPNNWDTLPLRWDGTTKFDIDTPQRLTIYEVHVQDFTGDESWISNNNIENGTYNAFVERGTKLTQNGKTVKTGFDHLQELGINAVQLMPVFDSDNDERKDQPTKYNWGYNPLNYNVVEGLYSSDPSDGYVRVKEFKNMVYQLSTIGVRTIMDVVYNHVSSPSASCFNKLMPRYFFRYDSKGELFDGSGCHNEFKSEATMARKYIVDSVCMWAREYKIKGFRFDLMALIDTNTMAKVKSELYKIDPDIYIYGEGWTAAGYNGGKDFETGEKTHGTFCTGDNGTVYAEKQLYEGQEAQKVDLGGFNDSGRNALRGGNDAGWGSSNHLPGWGFISKGDDASEADRDEIQKMIWGGRSIGGNPRQTINYASCHDNWTLRDQLYYTLGDGANAGNGYDVMHASEAAHAAIFASNGVAFMLGGEEILRTKDVNFVGNDSSEAFKKVLVNTYENMYGHYVSHNSYNSPIEVNSFKWGNKIETTFDYYRGGETYKVDTYGENITGKFAQMIKLHQEMPKYSFGDLYTSDDSNPKIDRVTTAGNDVDSKCWSGSYNGAIGIQLDEYFIYMGGRNYGTVTTSASGWTQKLQAGTAHWNSSEVQLGDSGFGKGFATLVLYRGFHVAP